MAHVLIAYASALGATREIAERIGAVLETHGHEATVRSVEDPVDVTSYDAIIVGSGIFAGHWHRPAVDFVRGHRTELVDRPVWLFSDGPVGSLAAEHEPAEPADVAELVTLVHARDHRVFLGALDRSVVDHSDLSRFEKVVAKRLIPEGDWRNWPAIEAYASRIGNLLNRELVPA
jgi:menaquinone-dependent protoporphyrinogen oxidase